MPLLRLLAALIASLPLLSGTAALAPPGAQRPASTARAADTALDRYVSAPDPRFTWKVVKELPADGVAATLIDMTSQRWLTEQEVERPLWTHWVTVVPA